MLLQRSGYAVVLVGALSGSAWLLRAGDPIWLATGGPVITAALAVWALERWLPFRLDWRAPRRSWAVDGLHTLVSIAAIAPLARVLSVVAVAQAGALLAEAWGSSPWPTSWPWAAQLALAVVIADGGAYTGHRLMHATDVGWRVHVVHHTAERMYLMAASRSHPLNAMLVLTLETTPLLLLGISGEALALVTVFKAVNGLLQHSNADLKPGWLSYLLATSDVHRWHHSRDPSIVNKNFGNTTMIWDRLLGTFYLPKDRLPETVGIDGSVIPERYLTHLGVPFLFARYDATKNADR